MLKVGDKVEILESAKTHHAFIPSMERYIGTICRVTRVRATTAELDGKYIWGLTDLRKTSTQAELFPC